MLGSHFLMDGLNAMHCEHIHFTPSTNNIDMCAIRPLSPFSWLWVGVISAD